MDEVGFSVLLLTRNELIDFVTQKRHPETSPCAGEEAKGGKRRAWDTPSISDTVLRYVWTYGGS